MVLRYVYADKVATPESSVRNCYDERRTGPRGSAARSWRLIILMPGIFR